MAKGFVLDARNTTINGKTYIQLFGRLETGESFITIHEFKPYFFISEDDEKQASKLLTKFQIEKTELTNFQNKKLIKIIAPNQTDANKLFSALSKKEIDSYEADLKPQTRFLIDNDILQGIEINGEKESNERVDFLYTNPEIKPSETKTELSVVSLDIESDKKFDKLYCIGIYSKNYKKNFIVSNKELKHAISCKDERELLTKFKEEILKIDPDVITGWHVIDFDLAFLKKKFDEHKIQFDLGRTNENPRLRIDSGFFRPSTADIPGRKVLDALNLIKDPFIKEAPSIKKAKFDSYTLEDVSQEILKDGKLLKGKSRHNDLDELYKQNKHQELVDYNIQDCKLVYDIIEKTKMLDLAVERSGLTGLQLDKITTSIAAFDSLYIREARKRGLVSPSTHYTNKPQRIKGGYVMDSQPGIYNNVLVLDFKSLYPSIIKTFNIDPASHLEKKQKNAIESPNKAYFKNQEGILPEIIDKLHNAREKAKKENRELSSYAIKIIMNSFFGVLASPNCRYFSLEMANAITHFAQQIIKLTAKEIEKQNPNLKVIYSDTDSVFVDTELSKSEANKLGKKIESDINKFFSQYVKENYSRTSFLELQFEKQFLAYLLPPIRSSEKASKKRYAGLIEKSGKEEIQVVGLEAIRGDWTEAAQEFQIKLLDKIFHKEEFVQFIRDYIKKLEQGKLDKKLVYRKSIRKSLDKYTKTTPPHVKAARKLEKLESNLIQYYITEAGPEPLQALKHKIDYKHYIEKQIKPIANTILFFFDKDFNEIIASSKQMKLF